MLASASCLMRERQAVCLAFSRAFAPPACILAEGQPIRLLRDELLHSRHWHNMGYPYPSVVDWDGDGLPDLMLPNETNRIVWYRNVGTLQEPRFAAALGAAWGVLGKS